jgi:hypothetical protein
VSTTNPANNKTIRGTIAFEEDDNDLLDEVSFNDGGIDQISSPTPYKKKQFSL